jgi:hypothetical protein
MGIRLSFGKGPLRVSVPLTSSGSRRRRKTWHGTATLPDGSKYKCPHNHQTQEAATACAQRYLRQKAGAPSSRAGRPAAQNPAATDRAIRTLLGSLAAVDSDQSAKSFADLAALQIRDLTGDDPQYKAAVYNSFKAGAVSQGRAEIDACRRARHTTGTQAEIDALTARAGLVSKRADAVEALAHKLGMKLC